MTDNEAFLKRKKDQVFDIALQYTTAQKELNRLESLCIEARAKVANLDVWGRALTLELEILEEIVRKEKENE